MYKYFLTLLLLSQTRTQERQEKQQCDLVKFGNRQFDRKMLFHGYGKAYSMVMHESTGDLFFSHVIRSDDLMNREIMACNIITETCRAIPGISGGYTVAYEADTNELFFGGMDGVYQYDFSNKVAYRVGANGSAIYSIAVLRHLFYYVVYPKRRLFIIKGRNFKRPIRAFDVEIELYYITKSYFVFFTNRTGLYRINPPVAKHQPILLHDTIHIRQFIKRPNGSIYFCAYEGIYENDIFLRNVTKVCELDKPFGMAFSKSAIFYSDAEAIYSLVSSEKCINDTYYPTANASRTAISLTLEGYL